MWWVVAVVAVVVGVATYLTWLAARVDRLHVRAAAARSALDSQSLRRAVAARDLAEARDLPEVEVVARAVLDADPDELLTNDLTRVLRKAVIGLDAADVAGVTAASRRLAVAREVCTDLVRDARAVRRHPLVRLFRFSRRHPEPVFFDIDDPTLDD